MLKVKSDVDFKGKLKVALPEASDPDKMVVVEGDELKEIDIPDSHPRKHDVTNGEDHEMNRNRMLGDTTAAAGKTNPKELTKESVREWLGNQLPTATEGQIAVKGAEDWGAEDTEELPTEELPTEELPTEEIPFRFEDKTYGLLYFEI